MKKLNYLIAFLIFSMLIISCKKDDDQDNVITCNTNVYHVVTGDQNIGTAELKRDGDKISTTCQVNGLTSGHAYTLWWVVWNKSENCAAPNNCSPNPDLGSATVEVELMYADGVIVGNNGIANFSASLMEGDASGSIYDIIGKPSYGGLQDAMDSEVHLVIRSHGPEIDGQSNAQISSFLGGCTTNFPGFSEIPDAEGECGNIIAAKFLRDCN